MHQVYALGVQRHTSRLFYGLNNMRSLSQVSPFPNTPALVLM